MSHRNMLQLYFVTSQGPDNYPNEAAAWLILTMPLICKRLAGGALAAEGLRKLTCMLLQVQEAMVFQSIEICVRSEGACPQQQRMFQQ